MKTKEQMYVVVAKLTNMIKALTAADVPGFAEMTAAVGGSRMHQFTPPPERPPGKILKGEAEETAKELVRLLREEAKAI